MGELPEFNQKHKGHSLTHTHKSGKSIKLLQNWQYTDCSLTPTPKYFRHEKKPRDP